MADLVLQALRRARVSAVACGDEAWVGRIDARIAELQSADPQPEPARIDESYGNQEEQEYDWQVPKPRPPGRPRKRKDD